MATHPTRFNFSFSELSVAEQPLRVLESSAQPVPGGAQRVAPLKRPRWLPPLLPVFSAADPLHVELRATAAPPFAARTLNALAAIYATAGHEAGISVAQWAAGLAVGCHSLDRIGEQPHAVLVAASLERQSVEVAADLLRRVPSDRAWLVVEGDLPAADRPLGLERLVRQAGPERVVRLPLPGLAELAALARGGQPGMACRPTGRRHLDLARRLVRAYLEQQT